MSRAVGHGYNTICRRVDCIFIIRHKSISCFSYSCRLLRIVLKIALHTDTAAMDMNREIQRPPNTKRVKRQVQQARLAAKQSRSRGGILTTLNEKEYGSYEGKARAVKGLGLLFGFGEKCSLSSPNIIAAALLFALTLLIPSTMPSTIGKLAKICFDFYSNESQQAKNQMI